MISLFTAIKCMKIEYLLHYYEFFEYLLFFIKDFSVKSLMNHQNLNTFRTNR